MKKMRRKLPKDEITPELLQKFEEIFPTVRSTIYEWDLADVKKASSGGAKRGAFILASCLIDHLACFYSGEESTKRDYINFVSTYLPMYSGASLYKSLRCGMVHNYTVGAEFAFTHNNYKYHKRYSYKLNKIIINLGSFIHEVENASNAYFADVQRSDLLKCRMAKRFSEVGILTSEET